MHFRVCLSAISVLITVFACGSEASSESNDISSDPLSAIHSLVRQARTESGDLDLNVLLSQNVQDPVPLENFNVSTKGFLTDLNGQFTSLQLHGLKTFTLQRLAIDLSAMNLSAVFEVPALAIVGDYFLDGTVTFFPISGEGPFYMNLTTIVLRGSSIVQSTPEGRLSTGDVVLDSEVGGAAVHFENLMGGGAWGSISNSLLNQLSELILGELKPTLLRELSSYLKWQFDEVLFAKLPEGFVDPASTGLVDSVLEKSAGFMEERGMDPMTLPNYKEAFERRMFFVTTRGEIEIYNGSLHGLSTLRRKGEVVTVLENNTLVFEAEFEFQNLTGTYHWEAEAFGADARGRMDLQVTSVEGFVRIRLDLKSGSRLELDDLHIRDIRHVWLDLQGLGSWDYIMESIVNLVTNGLKLKIADTIVVPIRKSVQEQLDSINVGLD